MTDALGRAKFLKKNTRNISGKYLGYLAQRMCNSVAMMSFIAVDLHGNFKVTFFNILPPLFLRTAAVFYLTLPFLNIYLFPKSWDFVKESKDGIILHFLFATAIVVEEKSPLKTYFNLRQLF